MPDNTREELSNDLDYEINRIAHISANKGDGSEEVTNQINLVENLIKSEITKAQLQLLDDLERNIAQDVKLYAPNSHAGRCLKSITNFIEAKHKEIKENK